MDISLRGYQSRIVDQSRQMLGQSRRLLVVAPTGAGKTLIMAYKLQTFLQKKGESTAVYVVHRRQLVEQTASVLQTHGVNCSIVMAGHTTDYSKRVFVVSRDTYTRRKKWIDLGQVEMLIFDEAHIGVGAQQQIVDDLEARYVLGYTATPTTQRGPGLGSLYKRMLVGPSYTELIEAGHLVPTRWLVAKELDTSGLRVSQSTGDFVNEDVVSLVRGEVLADLYQAYAEHSGSRNVIFAPSVDIAATIAARLNSMGYRTASIDWSTPHKLRTRLLQEFHEGVIQGLVNVDVFSEGWDEKLVDTVFLTNPTLSFARHLQRLGRGMRPARGKRYVTVVDLVNALQTHGAPEDVAGWDLEEARAAKPTLAKLNVKRVGKCPRCGLPMAAQTCACGFTAKYMPEVTDLTVVGRSVIEEHGKKWNWSEEDKRIFYLQLLHYARMHKKRDGWAAHVYKEKFLGWPPFEWRNYQTIAPTPDVERFIKRRWIQWSKATQKPLWNIKYD